MLITTTDDKATENANQIINTLNFELTHRIAQHKRLYDLVWNDDEATPQQVCDALMARDVKPALLFALSATSKQNLLKIQQFLFTLPPPTSLELDNILDMVDTVGQLVI